MENTKVMVDYNYRHDTFKTLECGDKNIFCKEYLSLKLKITIPADSDFIYMIEFTYLENNCWATVYVKNNFSEVFNEKITDVNEMEDILNIFIEICKNYFC